MKNIFKIGLMALATCSILAVPALSQENAKPSPKIGISFQELNNPFFVVMNKALRDAAGTMGSEVITTDAAHNVAKQIADIEDMIQQKIDILIINPTDTAGVESAVRAAHDAGVIVVAVDAQAAGPIDAFVGSKNYDAGFKSCEYLANAVGGKGEVAILDGIPVVPILQRVEGCKAALAKQPDIKLATVQNGQQDRSVALGVTENMIQSNPNLVGIFSVNDGGAMGALSAIQGSGKDIKLTSVDGFPEAIEAIKQGGPFIETTAQFPRDQIRIALGIAMAKYWGSNAIPAEIPVEVMVVDSKNADTFSW
ncbi:ABC transporter substrate-binding protein [Bartonella sp. HY329]|uniref:ABC transporter substrate-binding protein n=1 Tax=unclassified Bartonella TaxID=2645622 RepID=UPI0021CA4E21|nr:MULTISPECIES: ABC transporter substrate-binding protein [unclassified Bartonella]UXM94910.1 ABC transporter substrate-binding protein [Bartonella sp. HY329]UXN09233.1 ABC transporter substrate-binding protein [Bartonella sp. HY328]